MPAFQTAFQPSRRLKFAVISLHLAAFWLCFTAFFGITMWLGAAALAGSLHHAWRTVCLKPRDAVLGLTIDAFDAAFLTTRGGAEMQPARLSGASMHTPFGLFLQWQTESRTLWQWVLPDMLEADAYRRLKVWVRWCQPRASAQKAAESNNKL